MPKYQFYCKPESNRQEFTYLEMDLDTFLDEKDQLLKLGFEVEDDVIYADSAQEAIDKFKSNFCASLEDLANSNEAGGLATFLVESFKAVTRK